MEMEGKQFCVHHGIGQQELLRFMQTLKQTATLAYQRNDFKCTFRGPHRVAGDAGL